MGEIIEVGIYILLIVTIFLLYMKNGGKCKSCGGVCTFIWTKGKPYTDVHHPKILAWQKKRVYCYWPGCFHKHDVRAPCRPTLRAKLLAINEENLRIAMQNA